MDFLNNENKEKYNNLNDEQKEAFDKLLITATFAVLRGIDTDLYTETVTEMEYLLKDFQSFLTRMDFTNKDLQILKNLLQQGRIVIKDLINNKKNL